MDRKECVFLSKENPLPLSKWVELPGPNGSMDVACVYATGIRGDRVDLGGGAYPISPPTDHLLRMLADGAEVAAIDRPDGEGPLKVFFLYKKNATQLGIRTSLDWNTTHWGMKCLSLPGYWIVPLTNLPAGELEFKLVSQEPQGPLEWEPRTMINKKIEILEETQLVSAEWGAVDAESYSGNDLAHPKVTGLQGSLIRIGDEIIRVPIAENRHIRILQEHGETNKIQCSNGKETTKVFVLHGKEGNIGIRTSQDWDATYWGVKDPSFPGCWIVAVTHLSEGSLEFKLVSETGHGIQWEPSGNKSICLSTAPQIVSAEWAAQNTSVFDIPLYRKTIQISVTRPKAGYKELAGMTDEFNLVMTCLRDENDNRLVLKGQHIPMFLSHETQSFLAHLSIPGYVKKLRFNLAVMDEFGILTHLEEKVYSSAGNKYWEVEYDKNITLNTGKLIDIRPKSWRKDEKDTSLYTAFQALSYQIERVTFPHQESSPYLATAVDPAVRPWGSRFKLPSNTDASVFRAIMIAVQHGEVNPKPLPPPPQKAKSHGRFSLHNLKRRFSH